jgi:hypothetical protein
VPASPQLSGGKLVSEHGQATAGRFLFHLVLDDVPVLGHFAILEAHDILDGRACGSPPGCPGFCLALSLFRLAAMATGKMGLA